MDMNKDAIETLERQGCFADDWDLVTISEGTDLSRIRNVYFSGAVTIGANTEIINVPGGLSNVRIGDNVKIVNVASIKNAPDSSYGVGTEVAVLDETGSRPVIIYPGISAQIATIAARKPDFAKKKLLPLIEKHIQELPDMPEIGDNAELLNCGPLSDIRVWPGVKIEGAARLHNGSIVNNAYRKESSDKHQESSMVFVGQGVDAENFIIEDSFVSGGSLLRNTYVGQGSIIDKGFTSHDSLFFANCSMENGEACAVLAGPYSVSMHKSSLLIGCHIGFMNAGSGTNMSNHMYKMGPVHWGVLERGVKTSSNSYIMHGSRIGAYTLVMGEHKNHPESSDFPFSYLFGDPKGNTIVVPGAMLKSYGLKRDEEKWPKRDRRLDKGYKLNDRITYSVLNPYTIDMILDAIDTSKKLLSVPEDSDGYIGYKGMKINKRSLENGIKLYELALCKYLQSMNDKRLSDNDKTKGKFSKRWVDLSGQIVAEANFNEVLNAGSIQEMESALDKAAEDFDKDEQTWSEHRLKGSLDGETISALRASEFDALIEKDRKNSLSQIAKENDMLSFI
ncbi:MAG: DUF4954 family protein [Muribaculaceae bacterium]|nr:DUF4954 family protein [Muribaculaceae bacterium]